MPLSKKDNPESMSTEDATAAVADAGAGAPPDQRDAAEALPERNEVQVAIKNAMLATDAQTEAQEKAKVVEASVDSAETPSGAALLASADIADDIERGEEYARVKSAVRHGTVPASEADTKPKA